MIHPTRKRGSRGRGDSGNVMRSLAFPRRYSREEASGMAEGIEEKCAGGVPGGGRVEGQAGRGKNGDTYRRYMSPFFERGPEPKRVWRLLEGNPRGHLPLAAGRRPRRGGRERSERWKGASGLPPSRALVTNPRPDGGNPPSSTSKETEAIPEVTEKGSP
jgi:hypothetical protein